MEKSSPIAWHHFGVILAPFFNDFWDDFLIHFLNHFGSHFGAILGSKMEPKSIKNRFKNRSKFQSDFGVVVGSFLINFGRILRSLRHQKWCSRVGAVLFLRKSRFSDQIWFWIDFWMILDGFWTHFGEHFGIKIASKNRWKNQSDFGSIFEGFGLPIWLHFGPILAPKIDQESKSKKDRFLENVRGLAVRVRGPGRGSGRPHLSQKFG